MYVHNALEFTFAFAFASNMVKMYMNKKMENIAPQHSHIFALTFAFTQNTTQSCY